MVVGGGVIVRYVFYLGRGTCFSNIGCIYPSYKER